ncbi:MAG: isochorismatase family protein [Fimbriimonadales bacterium]|nr:isochorismatase family protein [Fimbriimonadales bacterium]
MERSERLLSREQSVLLIVDLQDTFLRPVKVREQIVANIQALAEIAQRMEIPAIATTQNAEKLGSLSHALGTVLGDAPVIDKLCFSCMASEEFVKTLQSTGRTQVVLTGVEAHICVMQTALDLLKAGYGVHVPYDAVASRQKRDWKYALLRLAHSGVVVTSLESVIYEWLYEAGTESFRQVLPLLKAREQLKQEQEEDSEDEEEAGLEVHESE